MKEMKNMAYWKAKNNIPGVNNDFEKGNNLPDGRSASSPFQQKETPKKKPWWTKEGWRGRQDARAEHKAQTLVGKIESGTLMDKEYDKATKKLSKLQDKVRRRETKRTEKDQAKAARYEGSRRQKRDIAKYNKEKGVE